MRGHVWWFIKSIPISKADSFLGALRATMTIFPGREVAVKTLRRVGLLKEGDF